MKRLLLKDHKSKKATFDSVLHDIYVTRSDEWTKIAEKKLLTTFKHATRNVTGYDGID